MSKKIHTIQSSDKNEFDEHVNLFLELGFKLHDGGYTVIKNEDGIVYSQVVTFDTKKYHVQFYDNEKLRYWGPAHNILDKTSLNGPFIAWHPNGQKQEEGSHKDGERWGTWYWWYEDGRKKEERTFKDGITVGQAQEWHEDGEHRSEPYKDGKKDGLCTWWHGNLMREREGNYKDDEKDGLWTYWDKNGHKKVKGNYEDGKQVGQWTFYNTDGSVKEVKEY